MAEGGRPKVPHTGLPKLWGDTNGTSQTEVIPKPAPNWELSRSTIWTQREWWGQLASLAGDSVRCQSAFGRFEGEGDRTGDAIHAASCSGEWISAYASLPPGVLQWCADRGFHSHADRIDIVSCVTDKILRELGRKYY